MKRIRRTCVLGMAFPISIVKQKLTENAVNLNDHIIKCVVYGDSLSCRNHWIDKEILTWIYGASTISAKHRISESIYKRTLFSWFGDDSKDCESNLYDFYSKFVLRRKKYPEFIIDNYLIERLNHVYREIESKIISMYTDSYAHSKSEYREILHEILD